MRRALAPAMAKEDAKSPFLLSLGTSTVPRISCPAGNSPSDAAFSYAAWVSWDTCSRAA